MPSRPFIYCCVPREGIMTFCFWYGLTNLITLAIIVAVMSLSEDTYEWLVNWLDPDHNWPDDTLLDYLYLFAEVAIGFAYLYGSYLAYKRNFRPFHTLLYIFAADIAWNAWDIVSVIKLGLPTTEEGAVSGNQVSPTANNTEVPILKSRSGSDDIPTWAVVITAIFYGLIPLLNKLYVVMKIRAYVKYVEYKKDESTLSSTVIEAPQKHPEISKE